MPGLITHYIGGQAVLQALPKDLKDFIGREQQIYNLGTQGPDIFFYYMMGMLKQKTRGIGQMMHQQDLGCVFLHMADEIKRARSKKEQRVIFAYMAGFIVHYALDAHTHPYVYSQTSSDGSGLLNSVNHRRLETIIDVIMLKTSSGSKPAALKLWRLIAPEELAMVAAAGALSHAIKKTYNRKVSDYDVYTAMRNMIKWTKLLQSYKGRRKKWMELAEDLTIRAHALSCMVHMQEVPDDYDYLNLNKKSWTPPWAACEDSRNNSFAELYESAIIDATDMLKNLYSYVEGKISRGELAEVIGNRSLKTGENRAGACV